MPLTGLERLNDEKEAVAPYVGHLGLRSIFSFSWGLLGWLGTIALYLTDRISLRAGFPRVATPS